MGNFFAFIVVFVVTKSKMTLFLSCATYILYFYNKTKISDI
jgi:hypothetical protein